MAVYADDAVAIRTPGFVTRALRQNINRDVRLALRGIVHFRGWGLQ
jgi:hypothetical protein